MRQIAAACGITPIEIGYLASGAESQVWGIGTASERFSLRIASPRPGESSSYESEFAIRQRLFDLEGRVSQPVCTNRDVETDLKFDWSLDHFVEGEPDERGLLPADACRDLGELLSTLHSLPVVGFGMLQNRRDRLVGSEQDLQAGILSRLERPWPFTGVALDRHPIASTAPDLVPRLRELETALLGLIERPTSIAVVHSDLHSGQLLLSEGPWRRSSTSVTRQPDHPVGTSHLSPISTAGS